MSSAGSEREASVFDDNGMTIGSWECWSVWWVALRPGGFGVRKSGVSCLQFAVVVASQSLMAWGHLGAVCDRVKRLRLWPPECRFVTC